MKDFSSDFAKIILFSLFFVFSASWTPVRLSKAGWKVIGCVGVSV